MYEGKHFSDYINTLRKKNGVSLQSLCEGLCSFQELSYLENGTRKLDRLLEDMLLERLGIGAEDDEYYLNPAEYQRWLWRLRILHNISFEQFQKAASLLEEYRSFYNGVAENAPIDNISISNIPATDKIERQFYFSMLAQIRRCMGAPRSELYALFKEALALTMPLFDQKPLTGMMLSLKELNLLLEAEMYRKGGSRPERYQEIVAHIEARALDRRGRAKIYPKAVYYLCLSTLYPEQEPEGSSFLEADRLNSQSVVVLFRQCNKALTILRDSGRMYFLWELLSIRETLLNHLPENFFNNQNSQVANTLRRETKEWKWVLESLSIDFCVPIKTFDYCYLYVMKGAFCINDVVRIRRKMLGLSQKELCHGICSLRTLQRLESCATSPQKAIISDLFDRLGLPMALTRTELIFDNPEARTLMEKIRESVNDHQWAEASSMLKKLKKMVPLNIKSNLQVVENAELSIKWEQREISKNEYCRQMLKTLELTLPYHAFLEEGQKYLTISEQTCIQNLMLAMDKNSPEFLLCLHRLEEIYLPYAKAEILEAVSGKYEYIMGYAASTWGNMGQYDKSDEYDNSITQGCLRFHRLINLHDSLYDRWWNHSQRKKEGIPTDQNLNGEKELTRCLLLSKFVKHKYSEDFFQKKLASLSD